MKQLSLTVLAALMLGTPALVRAQVNLLTNPGFESGMSINVVPSSAGVWGADTNAIVTAENGITPLGGTKMLKFVDTTPSDVPSDGTGADVVQLIDVSSFAAAIAAGQATATFSASFNRITGDGSTDTQFNVEIRPYSGSIADFPTNLNTWIGSSALGTFDSDGDTSTWQSISTSLLLPAGTTYLGVWLSAIENMHNDHYTFTEFAGHYADNASLTIAVIPEPSTFGLFAGLLGLGLVVHLRRKRP